MYHTDESEHKKNSKMNSKTLAFMLLISISINVIEQQLEMDFTRAM